MELIYQIIFLGMFSIIGVGYLASLWMARVRIQRILASKRIADLGEFVAVLRLTEISRQTDPGNEQCDLVLFATPNAGTRILVMVDASEDESGNRSMYWLEVPRECETAIEAAAWTFGLSATDYAPLERAS